MTQTDAQLILKEILDCDEVKKSEARLKKRYHDLTLEHEALKQVMQRTFHTLTLIGVVEWANATTMDIDGGAFTYRVRGNNTMKSGDIVMVVGTIRDSSEEATSFIQVTLKYVELVGRAQEVNPDDHESA